MKKQRKYHLHSGNSGAAITVRVTPRMPRNELSEIMDDGTVKIRLTAAPVDGQANKVLIEYLSKILDVSPTSIDIVSGESSRNKLVTILGIEIDTVDKRIRENLRKK